MIERPLMTPDELKSMPKGQFVVMKTGAHPMKVRLKLFFNWGITFDEKNPYTVKENANGVENNGYTNDKVTFEWDDEAIVTLTKDGAVIEYESGDELIEDGVYTLTFENYDGYKATRLQGNL